MCKYLTHKRQANAETHPSPTKLRETMQASREGGGQQ